MSKPIDPLATEASHVPLDQRLARADRILTSVEPEPSPEIEAAWESEIAERIRRLDVGGAVLVPASEAFVAVTRRLGR